ncbi:hypothetical protein MMC24_002041 [Lignoscripta atroalba]|nr:hypothetical protein [Lignoscripta atroalba]
MSPPPSLPLVDISPCLTINPSPSSLRTCTTTLSAACTNHGFFYLTHHSIPSSLTDRVLSLAREFFTQCTDEEKQRIRRRDAGVGYGDGARGYQVVGDNVTQGRRDWHEAVDWYRPIGEEKATSYTEGLPTNGHAGKRNRDDGEDRKGERPQQRKLRQPPFELLRGVNLWPDKPAEFKQVYEIYVQKMLELGTAVVRAMGHALELDDPETFVKATRESFWVMRAIGYPSLPLQKKKGPTSDDCARTKNGTENVDGGRGSSNDGDTDGVSCGAHTDYGCLTLLLADGTTGALQVQARDGSWINADPIEGAFVVNIGDMMERWTNGLWKSTLHRVVHRGQGYRVSVPFFFEPDFEARVRPLRECVDRTEGRERWKEVQYGEHLVGKVKGNFYAGDGGG